MSYAQVQPSSHPISILESEEYLLPVRWCTENLALQVSRSQHKDSLWAPSTAFQVLDTTIVASWLGERCPKKKWKNMGKPGGKHRKHIGNVGKPWEKPWEKPILHFRNPRKQWCPGVRSCSLRPTQWGKIEKSFQDGKQKDVFLSFFRIASVLSIWIYLAIFFYDGMFIFYLQSLRREANSHTSHCCCASSQNTKAVDKSCGIQRVGDRRSLSTRKRSWINCKLYPRSKL